MKQAQGWGGLLTAPFFSLDRHVATLLAMTKKKGTRNGSLFIITPRDLRIYL
jgi:hypothetical protein